MEFWRISKLALPVLMVSLFVLPAMADTPFDLAVTWVQKGDLFYSEGQYGDAVTAYNTSVILDPYNSIAWSKLGDAQSRIGRYSDAVQSYSEAVRLDPYFGKAWVSRGNALHMEGSDQEALDSYNRAISINPNDMRAILNKGLTLKGIGDQEDARAAFTEVLRIADREVRVHPNDAKYNADLWSSRGTALAELGRYQEALQSYDEALAINPKNEDALRDKAALLRTLDSTGNVSIVKVTPPPPTTVKSPTKPLPLTVGLPIAAIIALVCWQMCRKRQGT